MSGATSAHAAPVPAGQRTARRRDSVAAALAVVGATLGLLAGAVELTIGPSMRQWVGDKQDTTRLGLVTILLSVVALRAAMELRRSSEVVAGRRVLIGLGLVVPALICFTTVGRLWYLPGALLLGSGALVARATPRADAFRALDAQHWRRGLLVVCGAYYVALGATALGVAGGLGVVGGALIWAAAGVSSRAPGVAYVLLLGGALPFAAMTWWSVITPAMALVTLLIGHGVIRSEATPRA